MKKIAILCLALLIMLSVGCKGKANDKTQADNTSSTNSEIEITPGVTDNIFDENGSVIDGVSTLPTPGIEPDDDDKTEQNNDIKDLTKFTYEEFLAMTAKEREECMKAFPTVEEFFAWYEKVKKEYEDANPPIDVGDGNIDLDEVLGGKK